MSTIINASELKLTDTAIEGLVGSMARLFMQAGSAKEVAVLALATATIEEVDCACWSYCDGDHNAWRLVLLVPIELYGQFDEEERTALENSIESTANSALRGYRHDSIRFVLICSHLEHSDLWRVQAKNWLTGSGITNQGRVRSDNIASRSKDGLLFRSQPEINLYSALKSVGISFAPLPVFIRGGETYRRIEPDFIAIKDGVILQIEIDGDTVHRESPAEAQKRTAILEDEGVHVVRFEATDCNTPEKAKNAATRVLQTIQKRKELRN